MRSEKSKYQNTTLKKKKEKKIFNYSKIQLENQRSLT